jgi:acetyltransferase-like isoleucine patch superfamily enzyme
LRWKSNYFKLFLKVNGVNFGKKLNLYGIPIIYKQKNAEITLGDNCTIRSSFLSNLVGLYQRSIIIARDKAKISIGNKVGLSGVTIYSRKEIFIGDNTNIGGNSKILDNDFHPIEPNARLIDDNREIKAKNIYIGTNVFIGCNSIILKGTKIGNNSIVGAGSVVSGIFPENVIIAGNPAKVIKHLEG